MQVSRGMSQRPPRAEETFRDHHGYSYNHRWTTTQWEVKRTAMLFILAVHTVSDAIAHPALVQTLVVAALEPASTDRCRQTYKSTIRGFIVKHAR